MNIRPPGKPSTISGRPSKSVANRSTHGRQLQDQEVRGRRPTLRPSIGSQLLIELRKSRR